MKLKENLLGLAWCLLVTIAVLYLTGCVVPGGQLDMNMKAASKQCQLGDMQGCQAWNSLYASAIGGGGGGGYAPVYAAGPRYGMGWVTPPGNIPMQPGPIGQIGGERWGMY